MPNPDYNSQVGNGYSKKGGAQGYTFRKGAGKAEGGPAKKDTVKAWPKPGSGDGVGFNRTTKWPVVKTRVVSDKVD